MKENRDKIVAVLNSLKGEGSRILEELEEKRVYNAHLVRRGWEPCFGRAARWRVWRPDTTAQTSPLTNNEQLVNLGIPRL